MCLTSKTPVLVCGCQKSLVLFLAKKAAGRNCLLILRFASRLICSTEIFHTVLGAEAPAEQFTS